MIYGIGIDIVSVKRIRALLKKYPGRFISRILSDGERASVTERNTVQIAAGRFAVKEALFKAMGGRIGLSFGEVEISCDEMGKPYVKNHDYILKRIKQSCDMPVFRVLVSISHEREYAVGMAVIEADPHPENIKL